MVKIDLTKTNVAFDVRGSLPELSSIEEMLKGRKDLHLNCSNPHKVESEGSEYFITISCPFVVYETVVALIS